MTPLGARKATLFVALLARLALLAAATGGCAWLVGVSEDPVVSDLGIDAGIDASLDADVPDAPDAAFPDSPDADADAADDARDE